MHGENELETMLYHARKDAAVTMALMKSGPAEYCEAICFHAQQAAEKNLKAVFLANGVVPRKIHGLLDLLLEAQKRKWIAVPEDIVGIAGRLEKYAVVTRYTTAPGEIAEAEAVQAVAHCDLIAHMLEENGYRAVLIDTQDCSGAASA